MAKISYMVGFTLHIGDPNRNEYIKQTIEVSEIDTDGDINAQLQLAHTALHSSMQWADAQILNKIEQEMKKKMVDA